MSKKRTLEQLTREEIKDIANYRKKHSLRDTAEYVAKKFGINVSHVTIKNYLEVSWRQVDASDAKIAAMTNDAIIDLLVEYDKMLKAYANNKKMKLIVMKNYSDLVVRLMEKVNANRPVLTQSKKVDTTKILDWQKDEV